MSGEPASAVFGRAHKAIDAGEHGANGNDLLGMATAAGDERLVRLLVEAGADPNGHNVHGWTALH